MKTIKKESDRSFQNKLVLITGGSRGLGFALAQEFLEKRAQVALLARDENELLEAKTLLDVKYPHSKVFIYPCDITDAKQVNETLNQVVGELGPISVLVNNAGSILVSPYDSLTEADFRAQMELHVFAVVRLTRFIVDHFRENKTQGRIVNICSLGGKVAVPHMLTYDTSKFALAGFSQGLCAELGSENISVTTVYPTVMRTGSAIQAVFKGGHEKEFSWFSTADTLPFLSSAAQDVAKKVVEASRLRRTELVPSFAAKIRLMAGVLFPEITAWSMQKVAASLPTEQSLEYKTGAQSQRAFKKTQVYKKFKDEIIKSEMDLNQRPKTDGKFNLGLKYP